MCRKDPVLKMSLVVLGFLGLAHACIPQKVAVEEKIKLLKGIIGMMSRLSPDDRTEEELKILKQILGLLSLQVLSEETDDCKEEVKLTPATTPLKKPFPKRNTWNLLKCAYMMVTFLFMSYNKGDWCYCHYCNQELDIRDDPCCSF